MAKHNMLQTVLEDGVDFESENVKRVEYDIITHNLIVTYRRNDSTYEYANVDIGDFTELVEAPSKQTFINTVIKVKYPCKQVS